MSKYWIADAKLDDYYRIVGDQPPADWGFRLVDDSWWLVETTCSHPALEEKVADIADNPYQ